MKGESDGINEIILKESTEDATIEGGLKCNME